MQTLKHANIHMINHTFLTYIFSSYIVYTEMKHELKQSNVVSWSFARSKTSTRHPLDARGRHSLCASRRRGNAPDWNECGEMGKTGRKPLKTQRVCATSGDAKSSHFNPLCISFTLRLGISSTRVPPIFFLHAVCIRGLPIKNVKNTHRANDTRQTPIVFHPVETFRNIRYILGPTRPRKHARITHNSGQF